MGHIENFDDVAQRTLGDFTGGLKDLATELPQVRAALIDSFANWVEQADFDGYRIDTIKQARAARRVPRRSSSSGIRRRPTTAPRRSREASASRRTRPWSTSSTTTMSRGSSSRLRETWRACATR
jgi:glycosidase